MRTSPAVIAIDAAPEPVHPRVEDVIRSLVGLVDKACAEAADGSKFDGVGAPDGSGPERVLADLDVDGYRYLLVRMPRPRSGRVQLSPREQEIVRMVAKGHPNKVIADVLNISSWTVCTHLRRIFAKLNVGS